MLPAGVVAVSLPGRFPLGERRAWSDAARHDADALEVSARAVSAWLDGLRGWSTVGVVGYSQGGAVALQLVRRYPRPDHRMSDDELADVGAFIAKRLPH